MKRKIYIFSGTSRASNYGIGTYIDQLILCLLNTGIEFDVICLYSKIKEVEITNENGYRKISIPSTIMYNKMGTYYYIRNVVYLLKDIITEDKEILNIFHLNFMNSPDLVICLKKMFNCKVLLVIHYTNSSFNLQGDYIQLKSILEQNRSKNDAFKNNLVKEFKEDVKMIRKCDRVICVAYHTRFLFMELAGIDIEKIQIVPNGLKDLYEDMNEEKKYFIKNKYNIPCQMKIIFFAGRLDESKGVFDLINAFKELLNDRKDIHLLIAGDGDFDNLISFAEYSCFNITFTGRLSKEKLYQLYSIVNIGVVPSVCEEFGFVAIEMMMHALPIIVSDTGGLAEIVEDGINGLKVPIVKMNGRRSIQVSILIKKINFLLDNEKYARELGERGRKSFLEKYELDSFREKMLDLYMNI